MPHTGQLIFFGDKASEKAYGDALKRWTGLGATLVELHVPDKSGKTANVVLGFDDVAGYQSDRNQYFGCTAGRVANRIAKGHFMLDGKEYKLATNNGPNHLHGGVKRSLDKVVWRQLPGSERAAHSQTPADFALADNAAAGSSTAADSPAGAAADAGFQADRLPAVPNERPAPVRPASGATSP